jgi:hypothetical protein
MARRILVDEAVEGKADNFPTLVYCTILGESDREDQPQPEPLFQLACDETDATISLPVAALRRLLGMADEKGANMHGDITGP